MNLTDFEKESIMQFHSLVKKGNKMNVMAEDRSVVQIRTKTHGKDAF